MLKTLHSYLGKELAKVTGMALVAFTLFMTVLAIIEPLRQQGLSGGQVLPLIGYTMPAMLSLTLPIAALFAATIVYGRFSQDNEMMACRASGIGTLRILRPALLLGLLVTGASLGLSNWVAPRMASAAEGAVRENVEEAIFNVLAKEGSLEFGKDREFLLHASQVDKKAQRLYGVVVARRNDEAQPGQSDQVALGMARAVDLKFSYARGQWYVTPNPVEPVGPITHEMAQQIASSRTIWGEPRAIPNPVRDKPELYTWDKLMRALEDPSENAEIRDYLALIQEKLIKHRLSAALVDQINETGESALLHDADGAVLVLQAARARNRGRGRVELISPKRPGQQVRLFVGGTSAEPITADGALIETSWSAQKDRVLVTLTLEGNVRGAPQGVKYEKGDIPVPQPIIDEARQITLADIRNRRLGHIQEPAIRKDLDFMRTNRVPRALGMVIGEVHGRIAYSLSCFALVAMGAGLGLQFRGGQLVSAFVLTALPAAVVGLMILMGKQMLANPDSTGNPEGAPGIGLAAIWSGVVVLSIATVLLYTRLARR